MLPRNFSILDVSDDTILPFHDMNDDDFHAILDPSHNNPLSVNDIDVPQFFPFDESDDETDYSGLFDADPDTHYYSPLLNSSSLYFDDATFNAQSKLLKNKSFSLFHINIRSLRCNFDKLSDYLSLIDHSFPILAFTETWLNSSTSHLITLDGYCSVHAGRENAVGGGVSLYLQNNITFKRRPDLDRFDGNIEMISVEIDRFTFSSTKNIIVSVIYRPPNTSINYFNELISPLLNSIHSEGKLAYLCGDFNIDLLKSQTHTPTDEFINLMYSSGLFPLISRPTRVTNNQYSLIDNIFTNQIDDLPKLSGSFLTDITDHFPVFLILSSASAPAQSTPRKYFRLINTINTERFTRRCAETDWTCVLQSTDCNTAYSLFHNELKALYDQCFPLKPQRSQYINRKSWLSLDLKNQIKHKNKLYRKFLRNPSEYNKITHKRMRNTLNRILRKAERDHYAALLLEHRNNLKKSWSIINNVLGRKETNSAASMFTVDGSLTSDPEDIVNGFNNFFASVGEALADKIPHSHDNDPLTYIHDRVEASFFLSPTDPDEVASILRSLKKSSPGWDDLAAGVVKMSFHSFLRPLVHVINLSFSQGAVPIFLKKAKVIPIFKSGSNDCFSNYRPISILPVFSKVLERLVHSRLSSFVEQENILHKLQFGFRKGRSTSLALISITDKISQAFQAGEDIVGLFIDFRKAFDCVNHAILLQKLDMYGIRGLAASWFKSYLHERSQYVSFNSISSDPRTLSCGVPQGSILGPLLFLIYINDFPSAVTQSTVFLYADDANCFVNSKNILEAITKINLQISKIESWTHANKLTINTEKTHVVIFSTKRLNPQLLPPVKMNNQVLELKSDTKFLGVILDKKLTFKQHILYIKSKIAKSVGILYKAKKKLPQELLKNLYFSFIYPYLIYGIEVWGSACNTHLDPLIKLQKRCIRLIANAHYLAPTAPLFHTLDLLHLSDIYTKYIIIFMFKFSNNLLPPEVFNDMFTLVNNTHTHETRRHNHLNFNVPFVRNNIVKRAVRSRGVYLWGLLLSHIDLSSINSLSILKTRLHLFLSNPPPGFAITLI